MNRIFSFIISAGLAGFLGCNSVAPESTPKAENQDGSSGLITSEFASMSDAGCSFLSQASLSKTVVDTFNVEVVKEPWHFIGNGKWARSSEIVLGSEKRIRTDTITFMNAQGIPIDTPRITQIASYRHVRTVTNSFTNFSFNFDLTTFINATLSSVQFTYNGTARGSFKGEAFRTITIDNVVRVLHITPVILFDFPQSGSIIIERLFWTTTAVFNGDDTITATSVRKSDGYTAVFIISMMTGTEIEE